MVSVNKGKWDKSRGVEENHKFTREWLMACQRVLKPNGTAIILEFSKPQVFPIKQLYNFYFNNMLPVIGKLVSKDNNAYTYLPESVSAFPDGEKFTTILTKIGYKNPVVIPLMFGIASIYKATK